MAQTGITRWRGRSASGTEGGDDVQKSLELLDKVLSEFDDADNRNSDGGHLDSSGNETLKGRLTTSRGKSLEGCGPGAEGTPTVVSAPAKDDSPSLGHQSEDDGYMSMNGKTSKLALGFGQSSDEAVANPEPLPPAPDAPPRDSPSLDEMADYPPPPAEAERIISNLLPKVSPVNSKKSAKGGHAACFGKSFLSSFSFGKKTDNNEIDQSATTATQTTLPKTRHQRPFGWKNNANQVPSHLQAFVPAHNRYGSLPYEGGLHPSRHPSTWMQKSGPLPPRTLACALDRHREVRRMNSEELNGGVVYAENDVGDDNPANFSDDSLEESLSSASALPPTGSKRKSIAWEVPIGFDSEEVYLTPGSTKVIGRRRKKSADHSSTNSINRLRDVEEWPEPPGELVDDPSLMSSYCESNYPDVMGLQEALPLDLTFNGTYVIRKGRKKDRNCLNHCSSSFEGTSSGPKKSGFEDIKLDKRASSTFDNIKELLKAIEDPPPNFRPADNSKLVRVASLPVISCEKQDVVDSVDGIPLRNPKCGAFCKMNELGVTPEEAEDELSSLENPAIGVGVGKSFACDEIVNGKSEPTEKKKCHEVETQTDLSDTEAQNDLIESIEEQFPEITKTKTELEEVEKKIQEIVKIKTVLDKRREMNEDKNVGEDSGVEKEDVGNLEENYLDSWVNAEEKPPDEFPIDVEVHQHDFGPLPPSPVDEEDEEYEDDEEYSNVYRPTSGRSSRENCGGTGGHSEPFYRCQDPPGSDPSGKYLNRPPEPLPHRVSDSFGVGTGSRGYANNHKSKNTTERRTLPSEFPGPISRRRTFQKRSSTLPQENTQTSCSLPETPIFARGCDIPRTPHRCPPDSLRLGGVQSNAYRRNGTLSNSSSCNKGVGLGGFNQAVVGAELLRLAGGPGRGWYPRHRQHRPASIEHLDRLPHSGSGSGNGFSGPWDAGSSRKPMTLPPNITPKFFHRSPRDALRRVTSLLIRGKGNNFKEKKEVMPPVTSRYGDPAEHSKQKKGFFKNFWKRSRHYSLDRQ